MSSVKNTRLKADKAMRGDLRLGILGGAFNPVHKGHLTMAREALDRFNLSRVIFIPASISPFKPAEDHLPVRDRLEMLKIALKNEAGCEVSEIELERGGRSYTIDTVRELKKKYAPAELFLIIGEDNLEEISEWKEIGELVKICRFIVVTRPGYDLEALEGKNREIAEEIVEKDKTNLLHLALPVSSTGIRKDLEEGRVPDDLLPDGVGDYLRSRGLTG